MTKASLLLPELITATTAALSHLHGIALPCHFLPQIAVAIIMGTSYFAVM
jgi:hypothetical protein